MRGVSREPRTGRYYARIQKDGHIYYLGTFDTIWEAAAARRRAEKEYFWEVNQDGETDR